MPPRGRSIRRRPKRISRPRWARKRVGGVSRGLLRQVHHFKRVVNFGDLVASTSSLGVQTPIANAYSFSLSQLPNNTDFTNLYDQYKINGVKLSFVPKASESLISPLSGVTAPLGFGRLMTVIDYDDANAPGSENDMLQYGNVKITAPMQNHSRYVKPMILRSLYQSTTSTGYQPTRGGFVDVANPTVPHYGIKVYASAPSISGATASSITYSVYATFYLTCKNTR